VRTVARALPFDKLRADPAREMLRAPPTPAPNTENIDVAQCVFVMAFTVPKRGHGDADKRPKKASLPQTLSRMPVKN
jgi:hypothetical protein